MKLIMILSSLCFPPPTASHAALNWRHCLPTVYIIAPLKRYWPQKWVPKECLVLMKTARRKESARASHLFRNNVIKYLENGAWIIDATQAFKLLYSSVQKNPGEQEDQEGN